MSAIGNEVLHIQLNAGKKFLTGIYRMELFMFFKSFTDTNTYTSKNKHHLHSTLHVPGIALLPLLRMKRPRGRFYLLALFRK